MDWTDTTMLEPTRTISIADAQRSVSCARVVAVQGVTLLQVDAKSRAEIDSSLEVLGGFRASGRHVVLCDTTHLVVGRQFGVRTVEKGTAELLVSCGLSGREIAIGARDAGLSLANVVVCSQVPGDTVLLLGIEEKTCDTLVAALEKRLSVRIAA
jgi:hypothetical protein